MALDDRAGDHEAETGAGDGAARCGRGSVEAREQLADLVLWDADPGVGDLDPCLAVAVRGRDAHRAAGGRELERVRDEAVEYLPQTAGVGLEWDAAADVELEVDPLLRGGGQRGLDRVRRELAQVGRLGLQLQPVRLDLRDEE